MDKNSGLDACYESRIAACMRGVAKTLGRKTVLSNVDLTVYRGQIHVIAGLNGAGKTTSIRVLLGLYRADRGLVALLGSRPGEKGWSKVLRRIGYIPEDAQPYDRLTGLENILFYAKLYASNEEEVGVLVERAVKISGLEERDLERRVGEYSKGMKRRLLLSIALMMNPEVVIADEPLSGLDVVAAYSLKKAIRELSRGGVTFILTTHDLPLAEHIADRITFIHRGSTIFEGSVSEALETFSAESLEEAFVRALRDER